MPFYEYQCKSCGHTLEAMQKVNDPPLKKCPDCGKSQLTRLMSAPVFRLKGGGWYETDFKGDQDKKKNLADRPDSEAAKDDTKAAPDAKAADAKGADSKGADSKGADSNGKEAAKPVEKAADKPAAKGDGAEAKKPSGGGISKRGTASAPARGRSGAKKAVKKPAAKAKRR